MPRYKPKVVKSSSDDSDCTGPSDLRVESAELCMPMTCSMRSTLVANFACCSCMRAIMRIISACVAANCAANLLCAAASYRLVLRKFELLRLGGRVGEFSGLEMTLGVVDLSECL